MKISIDVAVGGSLMRKSIDAAKTLLEEMTSNNYHWYSERAILRRESDNYNVDAVTLLAIRVDALVQRLDRVVLLLSQEILQAIN